MPLPRSPLIVALTAFAFLGTPAVTSAATALGTEELSSRLAALAGKDLRSAAPVEQNEAVSLAPRGPGSLLRDGGSLVVDVRVRGDARDRLEQLGDAGADIGAVSSEYGLISVSVPEGRLRELAQVRGVEAVTEVLTPMTGATGGASSASPGAINTCATGVVTEGDDQLGAAAARTQFDVDGNGVEVGVLSDSFNRNATGRLEADDVQSGDLPGPGNPCGRTTPVQVLDDGAPDLPPPNTPDTADEGRAMAQIVHDIAPGADLAFATAFKGELSFAGNIRALAGSGADVIVDDVIYLNEPFYQDGIIANAVSDVTAQGVSYFSMAFNNNRVIEGNDSNSWEAPAYRSTTCPAAVVALEGSGGDCMNFNPGGGPADSTFGISVPENLRPRIVLQWAEPWFGVETDLDLYILDNADGTLVGTGSIGDNPGQTQRPFEFLGFESTNDDPENYSIVVNRFSGVATPRLKWVNADNGAKTIAALEYPVSSGGDIVGPTIYGHNGTAAAQSVGAVPFSNNSLIEPYSSRGPVTHLFAPIDGTTPAPALATPEVLNKPDVSATDGGINSFFGTGNRFFGTSAAAPHAAAVGALQLEANPALTNEQVKSAQRTTASPVGAFPALAQGEGLVDARAAIGSNPPAAPTVSVTGPALTNDATPAFTFDTTGDLSAQTCQIDDGAPQPCLESFSPSPKVGNGRHSLTVSVADFFGQSAAAVTPFRVDTKAPKVRIRKGPKGRSTKRKARFTFTTERGAELECKLDRKRFKPCSKKPKFRVKPGKHKLAVHATDAAGNVGKVAKLRWRVIR